MAEEFVEIEQENDPLGILSKKPATSKVQVAAPVDNDPLGILKKKSTPVVSSGIPSQLPSQPSFPQQGYKSALAQGASLSNNSFLKEISKSIPKGTGEPTPVEGKWSNIVQNVFANLELAGTKVAKGVATIAKDAYRAANPYAPYIPSTETETEQAVQTPWQLDPFGNVIRGLHGNQERMNLVLQQNTLPNTFWGKAVSSVSSFAPDIIATALLPEAKLIEGAGILAKTGNLLFNNFTKYMTVKEGVVDYGEAREKGKDIGQASLEGVKGAGRGMRTGMEMALLGAGSNMATKSVMNQAEKIGLTGVKGMALKELVNLNTDVLAFGIVSPFANAALEGRWATGEEIANGTGIAALFRVKGGLENIKSNVELNRALRQTQEMKQGVAMSNFVDATPESIVEVYKSPESADELHLKALVATKKAKETTDLQKKAQYTAEAITFAKASGVKQATDMVIENKDNFAELKASNDLPESAKKEFLQKAEEINNLLNPLKKQEVDLDNKIKESEDLSSQFSQQAQQSQDPNQRAELEAKAREAKDNADNLRGQLTEVKFNQNRPDVNAGKEPVMEGDVAPAEVKATEDIESKKSDIEKRRQEELSKLFNNGVLFIKDNGEIERTVAGDKVDAKYDAELSALESGKLEVKPTEVKVTEGVKKTQLPIIEEIPEVTVEGLRNGYEVFSGNKDNSIGDIRGEANERRSKGEKFFIKETVKDGKDIFTLVDTTVYDEFGRPAYKAASVEVPKNSRLSAEALMSKLKSELGVTDKTSLQELNKITSKMKEGEVEVTPLVEVKPTEVEVKSIIKSKFNKPINQELLETIPKKDISDVVEKIGNGKAELKVDVFPATDLGTDNKITNNQNVYLLHSQGKEIGVLTVNNETLGNRNESSIAGVVLHPDVKGKGIGKEIYRFVNNDLINKGKPPLKSDFDITPDAINVWNSLIKSGEAKQVGIAENGKPLFEMNKPTEYVKPTEVKSTEKTIPVIDDKGEIEFAYKVPVSDERTFITRKDYEAEIKKPKVEVKPTEAKTVEQLRAEEQAELDSKIPNAEKYRVDGKVDRTKLTNEADKKAYDEVYNKYDKLITPLLKEQKKEVKQTEVKETEELKKQVNNSKDISEFLRNIITDFDTRYKNRKAAEPLVSNKNVSEIDNIKPSQKIEKETVDFWKNEIEKGKKPFIIIRENNTIDGHHKLQAYKDLGIENVPVLFEKDLINFYKEVKPTEAKIKEEKTFAQKDLDRAEAKRIHSRVAEMEPPSDAKQVALRYLAEGGKVSQDAINEVSGTTKRASLNTGRRELKTAEAKARDYAEGKESLDDLAHRLWENSGQKISERDIKDALMSEIGNNNTRLDASKAYLERYNPEYKEEQYYNRLAEERKDEFLKEQDELENQLRKPLDEQIEGEASEEHINNLIKQYEAEFERENKQLESEGKGKADKEISGRDGGKEGLEEEYKKIKSNKKKKDFVRNNLPEEFKPLADELTEAQMSEIVDSNFDSKTIKNIQDAIQKQGAAEVLQRQQEGDGGAGGERKRVEQGKQGDESARAGEAKAAEKTQPKGTEEGEVIGITHEQLNEVARELGFPEYEVSPETVEQWDVEAKERLAKDPDAANKLIDKYEKNNIPTPVEQRMMLNIISSAKAKINANPSPNNLAEFKKIMELSNNVGGRLVGQSLAARKGVKQVEDTLPDFLLMRENDRGYPFTESEIKQQAKVFEELKKEKDALKEALQKSEETNAKLIAEMGVNKAKAAAKKAAKKTREEYVIERKQSVADAREALKKLRTGEEGVTSVAVPYLRELKAVAPHVKKYIKSLVEEGANKLDNIVIDTYAEFKDIVDGITKKDILDIFNGEYDESKPRTRNEKAEELRLLQREAALIKELENVRKGIEKEKNPAQKVKKNDRITELEDKIKEVKRLNKERDRVPQEFTEPEFASKTEDEALASKRNMLTKRIEKLQDDIKNKRYLEEKQAPPKLELDRKTQLLKDRVIKMERQIEAERQKDAYKKMSKAEKAFQNITQITGIRRVMQTAFDLSVSLRQGVLVAFNPRKWDVFSKAFGNQMKSVFSDKKFNSLMYDIHNSSEYNKMLEDGIKFNELDALKNEERNEDFQKSFLYGIKIPVVRQLITEPLLASQRAADGFLNTARYELYLKYEKQLLKQGITRQSDPEAYKKMADLVMNMTGRGKLISHLESGKWNKVVSNTFYGARLMAANINSLNPVRYYKLPPGVRKEVMKDMLSYVTTTAGIMLAASAAGATVELDPDKPDFLQIRFGEKVYDITGGKAAYLRTFFRMVSGLYSRVTDNKYTYGKKLERAGTSITNFFRNKLAPNVGYGVNMLYGENTLNQDFDPYEVLEAYPMYADDFAEALKDEGITSLATVLLPNILGIGYGSYATQANKESLETSLERMLNSDEMNPELIKNHKDGDRPINNEEFDELVKLRDANIEKEIRRLYDGKSKFNLTLDEGNVVTKKVEDMTEEEVKKAKKTIASEATRLSKEQLFGKERKTREEKMEGKRLSRARKRFDR